MKKITILLLHMQHGGIEKQSITFANNLVNKYEVEIICVYSMNKEPAYKLDDRVKVRYLINDKPNRNEFKDAIRRKNPFKIIKEGFKSVKILYLKNHLMKKAIKNLKCDFVLSTRCEFANILSNVAPKGVITMTQEHLHNDSSEYISKIQKSFRNLDYLVVLGPGSKENYSKWLKDNQKIKIVQIPNILEDMPSECSKLNNNNIVSVGRLHPEKGFEDLLHVLKKVIEVIPNVKLTLVGGGDEFDNLNSLAEKLDIKNNLVMTGMVEKEDVENYMRNSSLYVMTSIAECFPMVLLEAGSLGLPLVSFDVPVGPRAIIENDVNGYLIKDRNQDEMANKIIELLQNKEKLETLGKSAREMSTKYLATNVMPLWYEIFDNGGNV